MNINDEKPIKNHVTLVSRWVLENGKSCPEKKGGKEGDGR